MTCFRDRVFVSVLCNFHALVLVYVSVHCSVFSVSVFGVLYWLFAFAHAHVHCSVAVCCGVSCGVLVFQCFMCVSGVSCPFCFCVIMLCFCVLLMCHVLACFHSRFPLV